MVCTIPSITAETESHDAKRKKWDVDDAAFYQIGNVGLHFMRCCFKFVLYRYLHTSVSALREPPPSLKVRDVKQWYVDYLADLLSEDDRFWPHHCWLLHLWGRKSLELNALQLTLTRFDRHTILDMYLINHFSDFWP